MGSCLRKEEGPYCILIHPKQHPALPDFAPLCTGGAPLWARKRVQQRHDESQTVLELLGGEGVDAAETEGVSMVTVVGMGLLPEY